MPIYNIRLKHPNATTIKISYIRNITSISVYYSEWTGVVEKTYRLEVSGTPSIGGSMSCNVYEEGVLVATVSVPYGFDNGYTWYSSPFTVINGIEASVQAPLGSSYNDYEEFVLYAEDTLQENDLKWGALNPVYKVVFVDGSGSHVVYQEKIKDLTVTFISSTTDEIIWDIKNNDEIAVDIYARLGSNSYVKILPNLQPGDSDWIIFSNLSADTSYQLSVYAQPYVSDLKENSNTSIVLGSTGALTNLEWVFISQESSQPSVDLYATGDSSNSSLAAQEIEDYYPADNYSVGTTAAYETTAYLDTFWVYEVQEV